MSQNKGKFLFDDKYKKSVKINRKTFHAIYTVYCHFLQLTLQVKDVIIQENKSGTDSQFNLVFLMLLNRSIQHTESIIILTERGLYGDAFSLYRNIISDSNMLYYLHFKPELIDKFLSEKQDSYQKNGKFKKLFGEYVIAKELKMRNIKVTNNIFNLFSKASHASAFGAQLYSRRSRKNNDTFHLKYGPGLERERSIIILFIIMQTHKDILNSIIWHRKEKKLDIQSSFWEGVLKNINRMDKDISKLTTIVINVLDEIDKNRDK